MRTYSLAVLICLILEFISLIPCDEAFVQISVPTAFALITAAVKIKAIWLKAYTGMRLMGVLGRGPLADTPYGPFLRRFKRSAQPVQRQGPEATVQFRPEDLMAAWDELEKASKRKLVFDEVSCAQASKADAAQLPMWGRLLQSEFAAGLSNKEYSALVSSLIGSLAGDPRACQFTRIITASLMMAPDPVAVTLEPVEEAGFTETIITSTSTTQRPKRRRTRTKRPARIRNT